MRSSFLHLFKRLQTIRRFFICYHHTQHESQNSAAIHSVRCFNLHTKCLRHKRGCLTKVEQSLYRQTCCKKAIVKRIDWLRAFLWQIQQQHLLSCVGSLPFSCSFLVHHGVVSPSTVCISDIVGYHVEWLPRLNHGVKVSTLICKLEYRRCFKMFSNLKIIMKSKDNRMGNQI